MVKKIEKYFCAKSFLVQFEYHSSNQQLSMIYFQKQPSRGALKKKYSEEVSSKFAAYFHNAFSQGHLWVATSVFCKYFAKILIKSTVQLFRRSLLED